MTIERMVKVLTRNGYYIIDDPYKFTLRDFEAVKSLMPLECKLESNKYEEGDWVVICPEVLDDRHNCFWHGLGIPNDTVIDNPTAWIIGWQNRRQSK